MPETFPTWGYNMSVSPYSRRSRGLSRGFGVFLVSTAIGIVFLALITWALMIIIGIVHAQILPAVIPAGFWAVSPLASMITGLVVAIIGFIKS